MTAAKPASITESRVAAMPAFCSAMIQVADTEAQVAHDVVLVQNWFEERERLVPVN